MNHESKFLFYYYRHGFETIYMILCVDEHRNCFIEYDIRVPADKFILDF